MTYTNRFTFTNMPRFNLIERGLGYLNNIRKIDIDGNLVHAVIEGTNLYNVEGWIDFTNQKFRYYECSCPYTGDGHKSCKHIAALMLYLDLYINGGSIEDMFDSYVMDAIIAYTKLLEELRIITTSDTIINSLLNKKGSELRLNREYAIPYEVINKKLDDKTLVRCFRRLVSFRVLKEDKRDHSYFINKEYNNPYKVFFSKYHFLYADEDDYYRESYWGRNEKTVYKGFDVLTYYSCFMKKGIPADKELLYIDNDYEIICQDDESYNEENVIFKIDRHEMSVDALAYFIHSIKDKDRKDLLLSLLEEGKINYLNIEDHLDSYNAERNNSRIFQREYFIGREVKDLLDFEIPFFFSKAY